MPIYVVAMVNLYARENVDVEVQAESEAEAEEETLRLYPDHHVLSVTPRPLPMLAPGFSERTSVDRGSERQAPPA